jgi:acyl-CoA thioesterase-1
MKNTIKVLGLIVLVAVIGFSMAACASSNAATGGSTSDQETIVCLGDSITSGTGATVVGKDDKSKSWPAFLQNKVNIPVINAGVPRNTSAQGLARVKKDVLSKNPRIVIIQFGGNDQFQRIHPATFQNNLQKIIDMVNDGKRKIYLANPFPFVDEWNAEYINMFITLASSNNIELIMNSWDGVHGIHMSDEIHPNAKGYELMAEHIFNALKPYLEANNLLR